MCVYVACAGGPEFTYTRLAGGGATLESLLSPRGLIDYGVWPLWGRVSRGRGTQSVSPREKHCNPDNVGGYPTQRVSVVISIQRQTLVTVRWHLYTVQSD